MLKIVCLIVFIVYCNGESEYPSSSFNFEDIISHEISQHIDGPKFAAQFLSKFDLVALMTNRSSKSTDPCAKSLETFAKDVMGKEKYALAMLDSRGKPESGILEGNLKWTGRYYECINAQATQFKPKYCSVSVQKPRPPSERPHPLMPTTSITVGGCYPQACSPSNITSLFQPLFDELMLSVETTCLDANDEWGSKNMLGLVALFLIIFLVAGSTLYDHLTTAKDDKSNSDTRHEILVSFSILSNGKKLLSTEQRSSDIHCLHGIRFISMSWVILLHTLFFLFTSIDNVISLSHYYMSFWWFQIIGNGTFAVDSFFFLSGLLAFYHGIQKVKRSGKMHVLRTYLDRYIRLTPPLALFMLLSVSLWPKFGSGPVWAPTAGLQEVQCEKYWYTTLLYFNNLYPSKLLEECYPWAWYLANDFQFHLLAPIFIYSFYLSPTFGVIVSSLVTLLSVIITYLFSMMTQQQPQAIRCGVIIKSFLYPPAPNSSFEHPMPGSDRYSDYMEDLYTKPWCRLGAYLVGMVTGYIIHAYKIQMPKVRAWIVTIRRKNRETVLALLGWLVAAGAAFGIICGPYFHFSNPDLSLTQSLLDTKTAALYNALDRPMWALTVAWVTIACVNGYGGPVNAFLSWKGFIPLSKLTYGAYLVHPLVIWCFVSSSEKFSHFSFPFFVMTFCSTVTISLLLAFVASLIIETPAMNLLKIWQKNRDVTATSRSKKRQ